MLRPRFPPPRRPLRPASDVSVNTEPKSVAAIKAIANVFAVRFIFPFLDSKSLFVGLSRFDYPTKRGVVIFVTAFG